MRGAPLVLAASPPPSRIIPAYAGSTNYYRTQPLDCRDHPRVCGEHCRPLPRGGGGRGSSPRMRGAREVPRSTVVVYGIIPAYAGSTHASKVLSAATEDHPRVCGEHTWTSSKSGVLTGSSPRMRGARAVPQMRGAAIGIIPAYAGSTPHASVDSRRQRDHPRVCGEHEIAGRVYRFIEGSSPRMRGAPQH